MHARTKLKIGVAFILGSNLLFFTSAWIAWMPWPASVKAAIWSILFFTPEAGTLIGVAVSVNQTPERVKADSGSWRRICAVSSRLRRKRSQARVGSRFS